MGKSPVLQGCWSGGAGGHGRDALCCLPHRHFVFTFLDPQNNHGSQPDRSTSCVLQLRRLKPSPGKWQARPHICIHPPDQNYSLWPVLAVLYLIFSQGGFLSQGGICILACREVNICMERKKGKSFGLVKTEGLRAPLLPAGRASLVLCVALDQSQRLSLLFLVPYQRMGCAGGGVVGPWWSLGPDTHSCVPTAFWVL